MLIVVGNLHVWFWCVEPCHIMFLIGVLELVDSAH